MVQTLWQGCVAQVVLSRPERVNALNVELVDALIAAAEALADREDCRAIVVSGAGRGFCAGIDLQMLDAASRGGGRAFDSSTVVADGANILQHAAMVWRSLPVPVIAAVHGVALGAGLQLALGADIRIVAPTARLALMEVKWGLVPDMGGIALLRELVRPDIVADLVFSARIFSGLEACELGIATRLADDPLGEALALAHDIANASPDAVRAAKRLLRMVGEREAILRGEALEQAALLGTPDQKEAVAAGFAKRMPEFSTKPSREDL